jgi:hydroxyacylglutathione hydrolase
VEFGVDGIVRHSAGHTPGSVSVELASHEALVGDLIASGILIGGIAFTSRPIRPPFEDDAERVSRELEGLVHRGTTRFYMGHGGPLGVAEVMRHARSLPKTLRHRCAAGACGHG